jgi:hypothetical protein
VNVFFFLKYNPVVDAVDINEMEVQILKRRLQNI